MTPDTARRGAVEKLPGPSRTTILKMDGVSTGYGSTQALTDCNLAVDSGILVAIIGPNGAGKSTLLKLLTGSLPLWGGRIELFGTTVEQSRRSGSITYMPQQEVLDWDYPMTVNDVVMTGRLAPIRARGGWRALLPMALQSAHDKREAARALESVGLSELGDRPIGALSGGQKKRALLARALAQEARLLLLDEPLAGVDRASELVIRSILGRERDQGRTILMVTHDLDGIRNFADRAILIQGRILADGTPQDLLDEDTLLRARTTGLAAITTTREAALAAQEV